VSETERKLLARLTTPEEIELVSGAGVRAVQFETPLYGAVFQFTIDYWNDSQRKAAPTPWVLTQQFPGYTVSEDDADVATGYLAHLLRRTRVTNRLQDILRKAAATSVADPLGTSQELLSDVYELTEEVAPRLTRVNMADTIAARRERYARREECPQGLGVTSGIDLLDFHTGGLLPGELGVVGGFAGTGKTMFVLNAAAAAVRKGHRPLVYTLEISIDDAQERLDAMFSGVSYNQLSRGHLSLERMKDLFEAQQKLAELGGIAVERPDEGDRTVAALCARARQTGCDFLVIDQLSKMEPGVKVNSLKEHHGVIVRQLRNDISRAGAELPCWLAAQANRDTLKEGMTLASFSNATEIEAECDLALGLHRTRDMRNNSRMRMDILKSRRSDNASFLLEWELGQYTRITAEKEIHGGES
jgi:replicative DNA helicase